MSAFTVTPFHQGDVIRQHNLGQEHQDGICKGLSIEWLRVGGSVQLMRPDSANDIARCARDTTYQGVKAVLRARGLSEVGDLHDNLDLPGLLGLVCMQSGKFFIGMYTPGAQGGHAIAAITEPQGGRWFDPNTGETSFPNSRLNHLRSLQYLLERYAPRYSHYLCYQVEYCPPTARLKIKPPPTR